jgi:branched-chain amino acid transport system ATP-binding protein
LALARQHADRQGPLPGQDGAEVLAVSGLQAGYGHKQVVFDVDLSTGKGEIVTLLGHNGAGKTTLLKTIFGMLASMGGTVVHKGEDITRSTCRRNVQRGMSMIPSERFVFGELSVRDNLALGAMHEKSAETKEARRRRVHELFPILDERASQPASTLSGGQQRILSLGVALMSGPEMLMLDEPSLGLAPALVGDIFDAIRALSDEEGLSVLLLEQNVVQALRIADRAYVMRSGRIILEETAEKMREREDYWDMF